MMPAISGRGEQPFLSTADALALIDRMPSRVGKGGESSVNKYPEKKRHDLTDSDRAYIRSHSGENTYRLARRLGCSSSQVAAVKAWLKRQ